MQASAPSSAASSNTQRMARPVQRIVKIRLDYNRWVADETLEDYALRFAPRGFRKWSAFRVANTAFGAVSFLALEAIGAAITFSYGFVNAMWAIAAVALVIFLTGLPIAYRAARHGLDMDLLARGAGFGYLGSAVTSLVYAGFIFFALEAAIMAQAFELWFDVPRPVGYLLSAIVVIPLVVHGVTFLSRLQLWTQPLWLILLVLPFIALAVKDPQAYAQFASLNGRQGEGDTFSWVGFGAAATVAASLIAQIGEQVDFLRFMPEPARTTKLKWWCSVIVAGPGWIVLGAAKMAGGAFLAFLALQHQLPMQQALEPAQMYLTGYEAVFGAGALAVFVTGLFVFVSQIKINVTNAYAGSLAWSNFFARLTHSHPGRVVWLLFNVVIAALLMAMGVFEALEKVLALYAHLAVAWIAALVADLVISKPLKLSPDRIEFRRAYLYDVNPSGFGAMVLASAISMAAYAGLFGDELRAASAALALVIPLFAAPLIAWVTSGRFTIAREPVDFGPRHRQLRCTVCRNRFEADDMAACPAYGAPICSLCCTLDARCGDRCKPGARAHEQFALLLGRLWSGGVTLTMARRIGHFALVFTGMSVVLGSMLWLLYAQERLAIENDLVALARLDALFIKVGVGLLVLAALAAWWLVLVDETRHVAQQESERQTQLLQQEIDAHRQTDALLQNAKEIAESANLAKSRFVTGLSHEMRAPLNSILGYCQVLLRTKGLTERQHAAADTIRRSGDHLTGLVDGLLELSHIESGRLHLNRDALHTADFFDDIVRMFRPIAQDRGLAFAYAVEGALPPMVHADGKRLRQIVINLLSNAFKFTQHGGVTLRVRHQRDMATIDVIDTGPGIAAQDQQRVFLPFERGSSPGSIEGTGLGLTITRMLAELMGGDIALHSVPGQGSRFSVRIYLPAIADVSAWQARQQINGYLGERKRVLVVDDEPTHRGVLRDLLAPLGFDVAACDSGSACLARLQQSNETLPDLLLLDINLPDMRGWDVARSLRERGFDRLGIVMVSANAYENEAATLQRYGADGFITKPVLENDLLDTVGRVLGLQWEGVPQPLQAHIAQAPDHETLRELLALSAQRYARALRARLQELLYEQPACSAWVAQLLPSVQKQDYAALNAVFAAALQEPEPR